MGFAEWLECSTEVFTIIRLKVKGLHVKGQKYLFNRYDVIEK